MIGDPVLVKYDSGWATGVIVDVKQHPVRGRLIPVKLDLEAHPVQGFEKDDLCPLQPNLYAKYQSNRGKVMGSGTAAQLLFQHKYFLDAVPRELRSKFREIQVFDGFERLFTSHWALKRMAYDVQTDSVTFSGSEEIQIKLQPGALLPCKIKRVDSGTTVTLMLGAGGVNTDLPSYFPEHIDGTFSITQYGGGSPDHFDMGKWVIQSADALLFDLPQQRDIHPRFQSSVHLRQFIVRSYAWTSLKHLPRGSYTADLIWLTDAVKAKWFSFDGLPSGITELRLPSSGVTNFLSLLMLKHWPDVVTGCKYASELLTSITAIRGAPRHDRVLAIRREMARLRSILPRGYVTLRV